jgi:hypothetical protein
MIFLFVYFGHAISVGWEFESSILYPLGIFFSWDQDLFKYHIWVKVTHVSDVAHWSLVLDWVTFPS